MSKKIYSCLRCGSNDISNMESHYVNCWGTEVKDRSKLNNNLSDEELCNLPPEKFLEEIRSQIHTIMANKNKAIHDKEKILDQCRHCSFYKLDSHDSGVCWNQDSEYFRGRVFDHDSCSEWQ